MPVSLFHGNRSLSERSKSFSISPACLGVSPVSERDTEKVEVPQVQEMMLPLLKNLSTAKMHLQ
jgi:hypothetical protein